LNARGLVVDGGAKSSGAAVLDVGKAALALSKAAFSFARAVFPFAANTFPLTEILFPSSKTAAANAGDVFPFAGDVSVERKTVSVDDKVCHIVMLLKKVVAFYKNFYYDDSGSIPSTLNLHVERGKIIMANFSKMNDAEMLEWLNNIITVAGVAPANYGLTADQITDLTAKRDLLQTRMSWRATAEDAVRSAVTAQRESRTNADTLVSFINMSVKINPDVSPARKDAIGIFMRKPPVRTAPTRPENLQANGFEDDRVVLRWDRAANKPNTQFIVECKKEGETEFAYLATTTRSKYVHLNAAPGDRCVFRVRAQRDDMESTYSNEASVY
jgi:hypothetical protein